LIHFKSLTDIPLILLIWYDDKDWLMKTIPEAALNYAHGIGPASHIMLFEDIMKLTR
jgi:hypothetical protein